MTFDTMGAVLAGTAMMLLALAVEGLAARLGVEAIDALLARRAGGTVSGGMSCARSCSS